MTFIKIEGFQSIENDEYMNDRQRDYFKHLLLKWRQEVETASLNILNVLRETSLRTPDSLDMSSTIADVSMDITERDRQKKLIEQIDAALVRIENGEYGYCQLSGDEIGIKRLLAHPVATLCVEMQEQVERFDRNSVKMPPILCQI